MENSNKRAFLDEEDEEGEEIIVAPPCELVTSVKDHVVKSRESTFITLHRPS